MGTFPRCVIQKILHVQLIFKTAKLYPQTLVVTRGLKLVEEVIWGPS